MTKGRKIHILIADDHFVVRNGLAGLVHTTDDMEVVAEAADGAQAIQLFAKHRPDIVLMDTRMPVKDGIEATIEIRKRFPDAHILMLTAFEGDADIRRALEAGVQGYALKSSSGDKLLPAIRAVAGGKRWMSNEVATRLTAWSSLEQLTPREEQVLYELAKGLANKQIAEVLQVTEYTVKEHLKHIFRKLQAADRTEALMVALQRGIIRL
jgi:DNA-binding NarL/FixJ family response regulator